MSFLSSSLYGFASSTPPAGPECLMPTQLSGMWPSATKTKINLGYDIWSPYIYIDEQTAEPTGFGIEFVKLMQKDKTPQCAALDITMVQDQWARMWQDGTKAHLSESTDVNGTTTYHWGTQKDVKLGDGVNYGIYHAGMTYTHLKGIRPRMGDFSNAITMASSQPAGILVKLKDGKPVLDPMSDLAGAKIVDVVGYAPTVDTLELVQNHCTDPPSFFKAAEVNWMIPSEEGNKAAMALFKGSDAEAMYVYADQAKNCRGAQYTGDCEGWDGLGVDFAYLHVGMAAGINGTTIAFGKKNAGLMEMLNPCIQEVMKTKEYYELCAAPLRRPKEMDTNLAVCFSNSFWTETDLAAAGQGPWVFNHVKRADTEFASMKCADGYCQCSESAAM